MAAHRVERLVGQGEAIRCPARERGGGRHHQGDGATEDGEVHGRSEAGPGRAGERNFGELASDFAPGRNARLFTVLVILILILLILPFPALEQG